MTSGKINDPSSRSALLADTQLDLGARFDPESVEIARKRIEEELKRNGLFKATVEATTVEDHDTHQVMIGFTIKAGKRARYVAPTITGDTRLSNTTISRRRVGEFL